MEFVVSNFIFLRIYLSKGVVKFRKIGKLAPRYIGPFEILNQVGVVSYQLALPSFLARVHDVFHVSALRKYIHNPSHVLEVKTLKVKENLSYVKHLVQILDHKKQILKNKHIPLMKVLWRNHSMEEAIWEREDEIQNLNHFLF